MSIPGEVTERVMQYLASADEMLMAAELGEANECTQGLRNLRAAAPRSSLVLPVLKANHPLFRGRDVAAVVGYPTAIAVTSPGGLRSACLGLGSILADPDMYPCVFKAPLSVYRQAYGGQAVPRVAQPKVAIAGCVDTQKNAIEWTLDSLQHVSVHSLTLSGSTTRSLQTYADDLTASLIRFIVAHGTSMGSSGLVCLELEDIEISAKGVAAMAKALQECPTLTTIVVRTNDACEDLNLHLAVVGVGVPDTSIPSSVTSLTFDPAVFSSDVGVQLGNALIASKLECLSLSRIAMDLDTWTHVCEGVPNTVRTLTIDDTRFDTFEWLHPLQHTVPRLPDLNHLTLCASTYCAWRQAACLDILVIASSASSLVTLRVDVVLSPKDLLKCVTLLPLLEEVVISMFWSTNALDLLPLLRQLPELKKISIAHPDFSYSSLECLVVELARTAARRVELDIFGGGIDPCKNYEGMLDDLSNLPAPRGM